MKMMKERAACHDSSNELPSKMDLIRSPDAV